MRLTIPLILASRSPRRRRLLKQLGLGFDVHVSDVDETVDSLLSPADIVERLALRKAEDVAPRHPEALTLAADTIVVLEVSVLGKPEDTQEACAMLRTLSGRTHAVYTGFALLHPDSGRRVATHERTDVTFGELSDAEIEAYVATGSPMDKAGAYGIQDDLGALFVERIEGDYYNVVGLPLYRLYQTLKEHFEDAVLLGVRDE